MVEPVPARGERRLRAPSRGSSRRPTEGLSLKSQPNLKTLLLFDLDGTLIDSSRDISNAANYALEKIGMRVRTRDEIQSFIGDGVARLVERMLYGHEAQRPADMAADPDLCRRVLKLVKVHYSQNLLTLTRPYPGVDETLKRLSDYPKAVLTNKPHGMTDEILKGLGWSDYFGFVLGGDTAQRKKPDPSSVLEALRHFSRQPEEALFVGDSLMDIQASRAARVPTCAVLYGYGDRALLKAAQPDYTIERFDELLGILKP